MLRRNAAQGTGRRIAVIGTLLVLGGGHEGAGARAAAGLDIADIFYEYNSTGRDLGAQVSLDGESWRALRIRDPNGRELIAVEPKGVFRSIGLTELFFEGSEPSLDEVPFSRFRRLVPPGTYAAPPCRARNTSSRSWPSRTAATRRSPKAASSRRLGRKARAARRRRPRGWRRRRHGDAPLAV